MQTSFTEKQLENKENKSSEENFKKMCSLWNV